MKNMIETIIISAMTREKHVIGKDNWLPWNIPEELQMFRRLTEGAAVIMGRKTYDSIGRPMPKRYNIVVTRQEGLKIEGVDICGSVKEAIEMAKERGEKRIFIIGGAQIYKAALEQNLIDKMYLSYIKKEYEGDTFFPDFDEKDWKVEKREEHEEFEFVIYSKAT